MFLIQFFSILILCLPSSLYADNKFYKNNREFINLLHDTTISVVAPASGADKQTLSKLKNINGLKLDIPGQCFEDVETFHSSSDKIRLKCLKDALFDNSKHVIWTLRGGYGSAKLIPYLEQLSKPSKEKFFVGFSDITALHIFLSQEWGWKTIHGNGIVEILKPEKNRNNFVKIVKIVTDKVKEVVIDSLLPINKEAKSNQTITGKLTGGNLTIVQTSIGTSWQIKTAGKILFLEDVNIAPYQLDRTLLHLNQAGLFKDIKAIIFGSCGCDDKAIMNTIENFASNLTIAVFKTHRFGHEQVNDPIIYNTNSRIISDKSGLFKLVMDV